MAAHYGCLVALHRGFSARTKFIAEVAGSPCGRYIGGRPVQTPGASENAGRAIRARMRQLRENRSVSSEEAELQSGLKYLSRLDEHWAFVPHGSST